MEKLVRADRMHALQVFEVVGGVIYGGSESMVHPSAPRSPRGARDEEGMMRVELRSEGAGLIEHDVVIESHPPSFGAKLPSGLVDLLYRELLARLTRGFDSNHVFCKVSNLVERVPHRELNFLSSTLRIVGHGDVYPMILG